ncbi:3-oxo-tetronate kinase [Taklimakanibacter deserti]|uniref:3-oxo-tetronate kinase n=1 Tax=Taklimakanibacter deserti TaxID=2267839 RepID=UPI000E65723D
MLLGVIADDFTGASDIANTLAKGAQGTQGMAVTQYFGIPAKAAEADCEAGVISLKSRSIPAREAVDLSLKALDWLLRQGCEQIVFKYCSTFDSTPEGNIGPVGEALSDALSVKGVVACPAFPATGRTLYQGHLFVHDRLLNESGLENHPLNPMTDADLRRWLKRQSKATVGLVPWALVRKGDSAIKAALTEAAEKGDKLVIVDALTEDDLIAIGKACADARLISGGSGIAMGLPQNFAAAGKLKPGSRAWRGIGGPEAILAGSCSTATRRQVEHHAARHPVLAIDAEAVIAGKLAPETIVAFMRENEGRQPLAYSSSSPDEVSAIQTRHGREKSAHALESFFAETARALVASGVRRLVVAGGETSGAAVSGLALDAVTIGPEIDPGVPALATLGEKKVALALKSGNFGAEDFFAKALDRLGAQA